MQPKRSWKDGWTLVKSAVSSWSDDRAPSMGAALSYYTVFSLAPLLLIVISIAGLVFGGEAVRGELFGELRGLMGDGAAEAVEALVANASRPSQGIAGTLIGGVVLLVGATSVFGELQDALDRIWRAPPRDKSGGLWTLLRTRLLSFGMILGIAFLLMVSLVLGAVIAALGKWWSGVFGGWEALAQVVNTAVGFGLTTGVFAMIYKLMPRAKVRWQDVLLGAVVTAGLFTVGKVLIGLYLGKTAVASSYGAAGSIVVLLLWVYYSAQIFLLGAEFTWVYARTFGSMRDQADSTAAPRPAGIPASSQPAPATAVVPAAQLQPPGTTRASRNTLIGLGLGIAAVLSVRFIMPRMLGRSSPSSYLW